MLNESILVIEPELVKFNDDPDNTLNFIDSVSNYSLNADIKILSSILNVDNIVSQNLLVGATNEDKI